MTEQKTQEVKMWDEKPARKTSLDEIGSGLVTAFAEELKANEKAKLGGDGSGSIALAAWLLTLLEDNFYNMLIKPGGPLYARHLEKARGERHNAVAKDAQEFENNYATLTNAASKLGEALLRKNDNVKLLHMPKDATNKEECVYHMCQGHIKGVQTMFPSHDDFAPEALYRGYAGKMTLSKAAENDDSRPFRTDIPDMGEDFYFMPSLKDYLAWISAKIQ
eukprot:1329057-Amphidinium_carterae.2